MNNAWFRDTLTKRIFLLMWGSLVVSHLVAHQVVMGWVIPDKPTIAGIEDLSVPSLPPLDGVFGTEQRSRNNAGHPPPDDGRGWADGREEIHHRSDGAGDGRGGPPPDRGQGPRLGGEVGGVGPQPLPSYALLIDYVVRMGIIAIFSLIGARWLAQPIQRLVNASARLTQHLGEGGEVPVLDESKGTVEVKQAARIFNAMAHQLSGLFRSRELFVAALSHDLRTPLTRVRLRMEPLPDTPLKARTIADVHEMNALIDEAIEVFRHATSAEPFQRTDIFSLCQSIVDDAAEQKHAASVTGTQVIATVRPMALKRVVTNLVTNAIRYGGDAMVDVSGDELGVTITVEDNGPGIPEDQIERVLDPFYRVESSRSRVTGGSGLGLYIARDLALKFGGELTLANRTSGGLRASLRIPYVVRR